MGVELIDAHPDGLGKVVAKVLGVMRNGFKPLIRQMFLVATTALVGFSLPGCSFLKDKNAKVSEPRSLKLGDTACLSDSKKILKGYLDGVESIGAVDEMFDCLIRAVTKFTSKTKGQSSDEGYTLEEIEQFLSDYFSGQDSLSKKLLSLGFELKATAIGGRTSNVTRVEIEKVKELITEIKLGLHDLDPHMDILLGRLKAEDNVGAERVEQAVQALNKFVARVSARLNRDEGLSIAINRIFELVETLKGENGDIDKYAQIASNLKLIFISGSKDKIRCDEWPAILKTSAKMYGMMLRYKFGLSEKELGKGDTLKTASSLGNEFVALLREAIARDDNHLIAKELLFDLILDLEKLNGGLPRKIKSASLDPIFPKIFSHILRPSRIAAFANSQAVEKNRGLGIGNLEVAALEYYLLNLLYGYQIAQDLFKDRDSRTAADLSLELNEKLKNLEANRPKNPKDVPRWITHRIVTKGWLITLDPKRRPLLNARIDTPLVNPKADTPKAKKGLFGPLITTDQQDAHFTHDDLIRLNSTRVIAELVLRSFTVDINRARNVDGLTTEEAEALYRDMRRVGFDLGVSDPRSQKSGNRTFMEANLFTSASDGDDYIKYREGIEWFNFVSASGDHAENIFDNAYLQAKEPKTPMDVFGKNKVPIQHFRAHFRENFGRYFSNLPGMANFVEQLKKQNRYQAFEVAIETASRPLGHSDRAMDSSTMRTVVPIIYYTESIFNRYDINKSGVLENEEAWAIFPIMRKTIQDVSHGVADAEWKQKMVFARLLLTGEPPPDDWTKYVSTPVDYLKEKWYKPSTDRQGIINLIAAITVTSRKNGIKTIKGIYEAKQGTIRSDFQSGEVTTLTQLHELSRCSPDSLDDFRNIMQRNAGYIFKPDSSGQYTSDLFVKRLQAVIQSDRPSQQNGLHEQCQHMIPLRLQ